MFRPWLLLVALALFPVFLSPAVATAREPEELRPAPPPNVLQNNAAAVAPHEAARRLLERLLPERADEFVLETISAEEGKDVFEIESAGDKIVIRGNNGLAIATGLNWYLKYHCACHVSWGATRLELPKVLPKVEGKVRRAAWAKHRYFLNYCCFGFTMPFWDWQQWEWIIDWMALNGVNTPLSVTGQEAVWQAVCRRLGMSEQQIAEYLAGPPYLSFSWMGCMDGFGGPLPQSWIDSHVKLQQRILARQRELGMTPVLQGFTGHVPPAVRQNFPDAKLHKIRWVQWETDLLDPLDPLFAKIAEMYMQEQAKRFGTDHLYAADTFVEQVPPSGDPKYLADVSRAIYSGMTNSDPDAVWVFQTWPFRYKQGWWHQDRIRAFLGAVPHERMLCLDLFCETGPQWSRTKAFYGKPWLWCNIQNFGWRINLGGDLQNMATELSAEARKDPAHGQLVGLGVVNEGLGYNPVAYDLMFELAWRNEPVDLKQWLHGYARHRYGRANDQADAAWAILISTVHPAPRPCDRRYVIGHVPTLKPIKGQPYDNAQLAEAWRLLLDAAEELGDGAPYRFDLVNVARQVLSNHATKVHQDIIAAHQAKDVEALQEASDRLLQLIRDLDELVATREEFLLGPYLEDAKRWGTTDAERAKFQWNARRMVTAWGSVEKYNEWSYGLRDLCYKEWSGMLSGFYLKRWQWYLDELAAALKQGKTFDDTAVSRKTWEWELKWADDTDTYPTEPRGDSVEVARRLWKKYGNALGLDADNQGAGTWRPE